MTHTDLVGIAIDCEVESVDGVRGWYVEVEDATERDNDE